MHGSFAADGRRLRIERGRLAYDGPVDNPSLDIVAIREGLKVEPGVAVSGPAQAPVVDLVSEPEVGEADQLSWLVLGTSMADARRAGDLPTLQAVADETRGALAAAGTRLSSRLAAICEQSLEAIRGVLKLQHEITRRLSPGGQAAVERKL
jgi:translocation and assembly module TamB